MMPSQSAATSTEVPLSSADMFYDPWGDGQNYEMDNPDQISHSQPSSHASHSHNQDITASGSSVEEGSSLPSNKENKSRHQRAQSQKNMLSKALQKANTAVLLDNAANFEGAMDAYNDACYLLQLVMLRSNGGEDEKLKLQEIRDTYMIRITELERMDIPYREPNGKALPERPRSQESDGDLFQSNEEDDEAYSGGSLSPRQLSFDSHYRQEGLKDPKTHDQAASKRQSLLSSFEDDLSRQNGRSQSQFSNRNGDLDSGNNYQKRLSELSLLGINTRDTNESTSWLDTIDESAASSPTSLHSKRASAYLRHQKIRHLSRGTEAEFDAALDAAVEAAYDDGLEPAIDIGDSGKGDDIVANARRNIELAKQKVREAEREAEDALTRGREMRRIQEQTMLDQSEGNDLEYLDEEAEEEERLLEEMTRGYVMDDFEYSKSALPRQSDSSSVSGKTWESSAASNTTAAGAALSTLAEDESPPSAEEKSQTDVPPTSVPASRRASSTPPNLSSAPSVRDRRLSGQNAKGLKIETGTHLRNDSDIPASELSSGLLTSRPPPIPKDEPQTSLPVHATQSSVPTSTSESDMNSNVQNSSSGSLSEDTSARTGLSKVLTQEGDHSYSTGLSAIPSPTRAIGKVPSAPDNLGKQEFVSKTIKPRNVSVPAPDLSADSPSTPSRNALPMLDIPKGLGAGSSILPTPTGASFTPNGMPSEGLYLFDSHIHSPTRPGFPNTMAPNHPEPLEPCPDSFLLRPFWLLRCIYQTVAHPSGGYLSTKLFVPRDVWRVKNAKIKSMEEKVSNCDLLTAALLKLAQVDKFDADAVLEEMQALESVLDQVQTVLAKKLGSEVGVHGAMPLFKASPTTEDVSTATEAPPPKTSSGTSSSKSYLTSWRKLRSKNSGVGTTTPLPNPRETTKDSLTISSLPMTSTPTSQSAERDVTQLQFKGPNANYMGALARLCDAAQVIDQIAQQVEDPGLKHSSPTLVGLELSTRHAAEFFGFYICRFALNDIGVMLDKFIKRGSEWVLV